MLFAVEDFSVWIFNTISRVVLLFVTWEVWIVPWGKKHIYQQKYPV